MTQALKNSINFNQYPLGDDSFRTQCKQVLNNDGALVMPGFLEPEALAAIQSDGETQQHLAYFTSNRHNIYLNPTNPEYPSNHPRNREVSSSKGCITTDQIPDASVLHTLYDSSEFRDFLCAVLGEDALYEYADAMSSINIHYASKGQELGWHFDNSSFAVTLLIHSAASGGVFEYVKDVRDADAGEMNYTSTAAVLDGEVQPNTLEMRAGTLVLFRGRNSMHRVTPVAGDRTRMLVVLAYNTEPGISLSESARMTFYGRLG